MERRLGQKMEELANAVTKLAVLTEKTQENERRLGKVEDDLNVAHEKLREREIAIRDLGEQVEKLKDARENCPARAYVTDTKERQKEFRAIRYTVLGYIVFEAVKWYLEQIGTNVPPIGGN